MVDQFMSDWLRPTNQPKPTQTITQGQQRSGQQALIQRLMVQVSRLQDCKSSKTPLLLFRLKLSPQQKKTKAGAKHWYRYCYQCWLMAQATTRKVNTSVELSIANIINSPILLQFQPALQTGSFVKTCPNSRLFSHERKILGCQSNLLYESGFAPLVFDISLFYNLSEISSSYRDFIILTANILNRVKFLFAPIQNFLKFEL